MRKQQTRVTRFCYRRLNKHATNVNPEQHAMMLLSIFINNRSKHDSSRQTTVVAKSQRDQHWKTICRPHFFLICSQDTYVFGAHGNINIIERAMLNEFCERKTLAALVARLRIVPDALSHRNTRIASFVFLSRESMPNDTINLSHSFYVTRSF